VQGTKGRRSLNNVEGYHCNVAPASSLSDPLKIMQATVPHPVDLFTAVLEATGGEIERINEPRQVASAIAKIVQGQGAREVLYEMTDMAEEMNLKLLLTAYGIDLVSVENAGEKAAGFRVSLTGAELGIAETGTLVLGGQPGGWGLASILPWVHVVLLSAEAIFADLPTAFQVLENRMSAGDRDWVWITGPSRTADIGHTLVMGAHGPNALHVVVVG